MRSRSSPSENSPSITVISEPSNLDLQRNHDGRNDGDGSKTRRTFHLELGPLVISGATMDRVRARIVTFTSQLTMDTLRPLPIFLGLTGPSFGIAADAFSLPILFSYKKQTQKIAIRSRISRNMAFFATNYALLALGTILVVVLMHPSMILYVAITWGLWWLHMVVIREDLKMVVWGKDLNELLKPKRRVWMLTGWTLWVAIGKCLRPLLLGMIISGILTLFHASMRDPKKLLGSGETRITSAQAARGSADSDDDSCGSEVLVERTENV